MRITSKNLDDAFKSKRRAVEAAEASGLQHIENLFVDSSGFGLESEPALTIPAFKKRIAELVEQHGTIYTYITDAGQFQVNMGVYIK